MTSLFSKKNNLFSYLKEKLLKTRNNIKYNFFKFFNTTKVDDNFFSKLEEKLILSDIGLKTTKKIIKKLIIQSNFSDKKTDFFYKKLKEEMSLILSKVEKPLVFLEKQLFIILVIGINGVGKTTTIGKLAWKYSQEGKKVILAAGDTFRAAAIDQLTIWSKRCDVKIIKKSVGSDPSSVIFDAIKFAKLEKMDVLIIDTAGRLQNKTNEMKELEKIIKTIKKIDSHAPHESILILDANTGQNAINQVVKFNSIIKLTGIIITKLDSSAKGGVIFSIADQFNIPIPYIGIGEKIEDLRLFNYKEFIKAIF